MKSRQVWALACLFTLLFSYKARASDELPPPQTLSCTQAEGRTLCDDLDSVYDIMNYGCTGRACLQLWEQQIIEMEQFIANYDTLTIRGYASQVDIAETARTTAQRLCTLRFTGPAEWLTRIAIRMNATLRRTQLLQKAAGAEFEIQHCNITVRGNAVGLL